MAPRLDSGSEPGNQRGVITLNEIRQQPELWPTTLKRVASSNARSIVQDRVTSSSTGEDRVTIRLHNPSEHIGFFERAAIISAYYGDELLPVKYENNYVTVFPGETIEIKGLLPQSAKATWVRLDGYDTPQTALAIK
jgi:hypothetical protein